MNCLSLLWVHFHLGHPLTSSVLEQEMGLQQFAVSTLIQDHSLFFPFLAELKPETHQRGNSLWNSWLIGWVHDLSVMNWSLPTSYTQLFCCPMWPLQHRHDLLLWVILKNVQNICLLCAKDWSMSTFLHLQNFNWLLKVSYLSTVWSVLEQQPPGESLG